MFTNSSLPASIDKQITLFEPLLAALKEAESNEAKIKILNQFPFVKEFLAENEFCRTFVSKCNAMQEIGLKSLLALGQGPIVFQKIHLLEHPLQAMKELLTVLEDLESCYQVLGGVVGYHVAILKFLCGQTDFNDSRSVKYHHPEGMDISEQSKEVDQAIRWGIESMPKLAEIYPVGGAGDRLGLIDEINGEPLPAAQLQFGGRSLLQGLIRDLEGREHLFFKLTGKILQTPIAMMTSLEKNNDQHIKSICKSNHWFNRPEDSFLFFKQPLVPVVTIEGMWSSPSPLKLNLKPGGHGVMWVLAHEAKIFSHLKSKGCLKAIVRQINNPVAGADYGLLAFLGIGCKKNKAFGFASCQRVLKAPEGMNVVLEKKTEEGWEYCLTNVEYTDFEKKQIKDVAKEPGSPYSAYPSNTNILFVDLKTVEEIAVHSPIPGLLINMKIKFPSLDKNGNLKDVLGGRLESTMQNIADYIVEQKQTPLKEGEFDQLKSFITFNERRKTISVTKTIHQPGKDALGTPEGCLYEIQLNHADLLENYCGMKIPETHSLEVFIGQGPSFLLSYHPALGPLFSIIGQKIKGGSLAPQSEVQLEIAELELSQVNVHGSLIITAKSIMGPDEQTGKCILRNVTINNKGINYSADNTFWKNQITREEELEIVIDGSGEFFAEDVIFEGKILINIPDGHRIIATMDTSGKIVYNSEKINRPTWHWKYCFGRENQIKLEQKLNP